MSASSRRPSAGPVWMTVLLALTLVFVSIFLFRSCAGVRSKNPYGPGDFALRDGYLTCTAGPTRRGLDVSEHQGTIDWAQVAQGGFDFVFVRIGYRGYQTGVILPDDRWAENLTGARAAGLEVGVYFYSQAVSTQEALEEAQWCLEQLRDTALDLPLVFDWEWVKPTARTGNMDRDTLTECAKVFCEAVREGGYEPMLYFNTDMSKNLLGLEQLADERWWLAQYRTDLDFPYRLDFWQYTEAGAVPGIKGKVDIDLMFLE